MRTPRLPVVDWTDAPSRFKWTHLFRRKTKSGFCACAITFQTQSTTRFNIQNFYMGITLCLCVWGGSQNQQLLFIIHYQQIGFYNRIGESYVYWTVHHLDSWIKIDQLDVTCFIISLFTTQHVSNVSTSIFTSLRLIVDLFHVLYCSGSMCVGVTVWFGWDGVVSLCRLKQSFTIYCSTCFEC